MNRSAFIGRIKHWGIKSSLGILDQAIYSGVNFLLSVFLARWISPEFYGSFSAAFSLFLLLSIVQVAFIAEPMSIFGADRYRQNIISYLNYLLRIQWTGSLLGSCLVIIVSMLITNSMLRDAIMSMAFALPFILYYWYLRRAFYIEMQSGKAMQTSLIYSASLILIILLTYQVGYLTPAMAFLGMALSSLFSAFFALRRLNVHMFGQGMKADRANFGVINRELWTFGKWILLAYLAGWFTSFSFPLFITILVNSEYAGAFRAIQNLFLPFQQFLAAITLLMLPWLTKQNSSYGNARLFSLAQKAAVVVALAAIIYCLLIVIFRHEIVAFLYANAFYSSFDNLVIYLALTTLLGSAPLVLGLALRVLGKPNTILWSKAGAAIFFLIVGILIIRMFQMNGVIFMLMSTSIIEVSLLFLFYFRVKRFAISTKMDQRTCEKNESRDTLEISS